MAHGCTQVDNDKHQNITPKPGNEENWSPAIAEDGMIWTADIRRGNCQLLGICCCAIESGSEPHVIFKKWNIRQLSKIMNRNDAQLKAEY